MARRLPSLRRLLATAVVLLAAACASKVPPPIVPSAPKYPDFVFPAVTDPALSSLGEQQRTAWA
jgi:hypothetical protein